MFLALFGAHQLMAQYDDIYFNPDEDYNYEYEYSEDYSDDYSDDETYAYNDTDDRDDGYDDEDYYYDDYNYYYTSRIRRFHRPYRGFGFYDPVYVDMFYYDPFINGFGGAAWGSSIYINVYNGWGWNRWNRWNSWGRWNDPWRSGWGWNSWNRGWGYGGWNSWNRGWGYGGWGYGYNACPTNYYRGGNFYAWNSNNDGVSHWGSRRIGTTTVSQNGPVRSGRGSTGVTRSAPANANSQAFDNDRSNRAAERYRSRSPEAGQDRFDRSTDPKQRYDADRYKSDRNRTLDRKSSGSGDERFRPQNDPSRKSGSRGVEDQKYLFDSKKSDNRSRFDRQRSINRNNDRSRSFDRNRTRSYDRPQRSTRQGFNNSSSRSRDRSVTPSRSSSRSGSSIKSSPRKSSSGSKSGSTKRSSRR